MTVTVVVVEVLHTCSYYEDFIDLLSVVLHHVESPNVKLSLTTHEIFFDLYYDTALIRLIVYCSESQLSA